MCAPTDRPNRRERLAERNWKLIGKTRARQEPTVNSLALPLLLSLSRRVAANIRVLLLRLRLLHAVLPTTFCGSCGARLSLTIQQLMLFYLYLVFYWVQLKLFAFYFPAKARKKCPRGQAKRTQFWSRAWKYALNNSVMPPANCRAALHSRSHKKCLSCCCIDSLRQHWRHLIMITAKWRRGGAGEMQ